MAEKYHFPPATAESLDCVEAGTRLGIRGREVYRLIYERKLSAVKDRDGYLNIEPDELRRYEESLRV